jgi:hypothetical protein
LLKAAFSVRFVPRLYYADQLPLRESLETADERGGNWCEMAASLPGRETESREKLEDVTKQRSEDGG